LAFSSLEEAAAAIATVEQDYDRHGKAAFDIARDYFDSAKVLTALIDTVFRGA
jgi:hypothetical protein